MRNRWFYLVLFVWVCSCSRAPETKKMPDMDFSQANETTMEMSREDAYLSLATQKLGEQLDIAKLRKNHPEFIDSGLSNTVFLDHIAESTIIKSLGLVESRIQGDTTFLKLSVALDQNQKVKLDTIFAVLISTTRKIADEEVMTTEISFKK